MKILITEIILKIIMRTIEIKILKIIIILMKMLEKKLI